MIGVTPDITAAAVVRHGVLSLTFADSVPVTGDSQRHDLRWKTSTVADYQYDAVSLRMEWTRGVVYGVWAS